jgi:hypothetical protein
MYTYPTGYVHIMAFAYVHIAAPFF